MTYKEFCAGLDEYSALRNNGLKKQANKVLFAFTENFRKSVPQGEVDALLCRFCRDFLDEDKFPEFRVFGGVHVPFQLSGLLYDYLKRECAAEQMPHLRWAYEFFGRYYNPHDPTLEQDPYDILKRAYEHPKCDDKTVVLYFNAQIDELGFGAHHFPVGCCIARKVYLEDVKTAEKIISEHDLPKEFVEELEYYKTLYRVYFEWADGGKNGDFNELIKVAGISFSAPRAYFYE